MITVRIISDFITDNLAIAGIEVNEHVIKTEGKKPIEVMYVMVELDMDWEIDFSEATDEELIAWTQADHIGRTVRAKKKGKTIILEGEPVGYDELQDKMVDFIARHQWFPDVLSDNAQSLILGIADKETGDEPAESVEG